MWQHVVFILILSSGSYAYMGAKMGVATECDDAQTHLEMDWPNFDFHAFTCPTDQWTVGPTRPSVFYTNESVNVHTDGDNVIHKCMTDHITYDRSPPLRGNHRPNWGKWGEYLYIPQQRWLHNLEHGGIIMLYHPCANLDQVDKLRSLVTGCLYRHVITPYDGLTREFPFALLTWATELKMATVKKEEVVKFIKEHALTESPENLFKQGRYELHLIKESEIVSTIEDETLCPNL